MLHIKVWVDFVFKQKVKAFNQYKKLSTDILYYYRNTIFTDMTFETKSNFQDKRCFVVSGVVI